MTRLRVSPARRFRFLIFLCLSTSPSTCSGCVRAGCMREKEAAGYSRSVSKQDALLAAYGRRCAISRCSIEACLSAAHIFDYSRSGCQEVWNGILLRADLHLLFDQHLLR